MSYRTGSRKVNPELVYGVESTSQLSRNAMAKCVFPILQILFTEEMMKLPKKLFTTVVCGVALLLGLATPSMANYDAPMTWVEVTSGTTYDLKGVWGTSATDVWAVGKRGVILHYNGTSWSSQQSPVTADLLSIWGRSASDIYAVGAQGTYIHYNGTQWSKVTTGFQTTNNIWDITGTSDTIFFALYSSGTGSENTTFEVARQPTSQSNFAGIDICGGSGASCTPSRSNERYTGIWMMENGEVFISGQDLTAGKGFVRRSKKDLRGTALANTSWSQIPGLDWSKAIADAWGTGNTLFFIASGPGTAGGAAYKYDRVSNTVQQPPLNLAGHPYAADIWGLNENSVYFLTSDSIIHYDGTETGKFVMIDSYLNNIPGYKRAFNSIWAADENNIFVVGNGGVILKFNGIAAQPQLISPANDSNQAGTSVSFSWSGVPYSSNDYFLKLYDDDTLKYSIGDPIPITSSTQVTLAPFQNDGRPYYWRIETNNSLYLGDYFNGRSAARSFTNGTAWAPHLRAPRDGEVVSSTGGTVTFEWFPFQTTTQYYLQIAADANFSNVLWGDWVNGTSKSLGFTDTNVEYFWRVLPNGGQYWSYTRSFIYQ